MKKICNILCIVVSFVILLGLVNLAAYAKEDTATLMKEDIFTYTVKDDKATITDIDDARGVTETLLQNRAVVLNLEGIDVDIAQRIIDFTSGSCYAINGNLQKISNYIFIITPQSVEISGDFQDIFGGGNSEVSTM